MNNSFIPISQPTITKNEIDFVTKAMQSGWVSSLGEFLDIFEAKFASFVGTKYAVSTTNGTTALHLALVSEGIKSGDEVILPDFTFVATANAVQYTGATAVLVDIEENTLCIDPEKVESAITDKTKAIIPVHIYGHPANMVEINRIAKKYGLLVVEDAAEAHGAEINGKKVGSMGKCGAFSFYGNKIITTGEGGMITTDDKPLYDRLRHLRDHAMSNEKRYWHDQIGFNYRMTNLQAALGVAQLDRIKEILEKKRKIFLTYKNLLSKNARIKLNFEAEWARNVFWMVCLEFEDFTEVKRDELMKQLKNRGVDSRPYFYPISDLPMYPKTNTPVAHRVFGKGINIPSYFDLDNASIEYVCKTVTSVLDNI